MPSKVNRRSRTSGRTRNFQIITAPAANTAPSKQCRTRSFVSEIESEPWGLVSKSGERIQAPSPQRITVTETAPAAAHTVMAAEGLSVDSGAAAGGGLSRDLVAVLTGILL